MKKLLSTLVFCLSSYYGMAQTGYDITINVKNCTDTLAYLTFPQMDKIYIKDTCRVIKNGKIVFKGKEKLPKGIYSLISQQKSNYFDFFVDDDNQKLEITTEMGANMQNALTAVNSKREQDFFDYIRYISGLNKTFIELKQNTVFKTKQDTLAFADKQKEMENRIISYEQDFITKHKGTFIADVINLKTERKLDEVPKKADGKPDNEAFRFHYKKHYWDNVNFQDDGTMRNPFFYGRLKKYFETVVMTDADSVIVEVDKMMRKTIPGSNLHKSMLAFFTYWGETSEIMGFDKVFVYMSDNYFKTGKAKGVYEDENIEKIIKRADKLKPLLVGAQAQDLFMIRAEDFDKMKAMGFENAKNSDEMTKVFYDHTADVNKLFVKLSDVKAAYTMLVFWDVDCGHCQKEIPKLLDVYNELTGQKIDLKVYSVYMQHEGDKYLKYIADHHLPWINVYDGAHYNNAIEKYDVFSTPVVYLLDKNKKIIAKRINAEQLKKFITDKEKDAKKV